MNPCKKPYDLKPNLESVSHPPYFSNEVAVLNQKIKIFALFYVVTTEPKPPP